MASHISSEQMRGRAQIARIYVEVELVPQGSGHQYIPEPQWKDQYSTTGKLTCHGQGQLLPAPGRINTMPGYQRSDEVNLV